jgi:hypothetical protein
VPPVVTPGTQGAQSSDLVYVTAHGGYVTVYSYPDGKLLQTLRGLGGPAAPCVDANGDVYVPDLVLDQVFEYAHGGTKPIAKLKAAALDPGGCSVDPLTGNLAVASLGFGSGNPGNVAIYAGGRGKPVVYRARGILSYFRCGYDDKGNLFVDGLNNSDHFELAELPKGSKTFTNITLNQKIGWPGSVQWNAGELVVSGQLNKVYAFGISGSIGTLKHTTRLDGPKFVIGFWIQGQTILAATEGGNRQTLNYYSYPSGGNPTKIVTRGVGGPGGVVVSPGSGS